MSGAPHDGSQHRLAHGVVDGDAVVDDAIDADGDGDVDRLLPYDTDGDTDALGERDTHAHTPDVQTTTP